MLHELGFIFNFNNKTITWQEVSKFFFVIKESRSVRNATQRIKQILDAEYKKIDQNTIIMSLNHLKNKHLQKYENIFDRTLGKYTGSDYTKYLQENYKPYHAKPFLIPNIHN